MSEAARRVDDATAPLRKFYAPSIREGLALVRRELGEEAMILDIKTIRRDDARGPAREEVELWVQGAGAPSPPAPAPEAPPALDELEERFRRLAEQLHVAHRQIEEMSSGLQWIGMGLSGLSEETSCRIADCLAGAVPVSGGIRLADRQAVVALVGPTGVGKTTQVARLAWRFAREAGRRVGVVTTDTESVGGVEIIGRYCRHLDVPLEVVDQADEVPAARARLHDRDLILVDTAGGSQRDAAYLENLAALLRALDPTEVHLVAAATCSAAVFRELVQAYAVVHPDQVLFTKLDEAATLMELLPPVLAGGLAVSYCGSGQSVPGMLEIASADVISRFIVRE